MRGRSSAHSKAALVLPLCLRPLLAQIRPPNRSRVCPRVGQKKNGLYSAAFFFCLPPSPPHDGKRMIYHARNLHRGRGVCQIFREFHRLVSRRVICLSRILQTRAHRQRGGICQLGRRSRRPQRSGADFPCRRQTHERE